MLLRELRRNTTPVRASSDVSGVDTDGDAFRCNPDPHIWREFIAGVGPPRDKAIRSRETSQVRLHLRHEDADVLTDGLLDGRLQRASRAA